MAEHHDRRSEVIDGYRRHVSPGLARMAEMMAAPVIERAVGDHLYAEDGERFLDCGGYSIFLLGHSHPAILAAVREQLDRLSVTGPLVFHRTLPEAARALASVSPDGLDYVFFNGSGAEACETALKLACLAGRTKLVAAEGGYHGKTIGALSITGRAAYREPFQAILPAATFVPFGDLDALAAVVDERTCVVLEPVQAEAGVRIPPAGYLRAVQDLCEARGAILVVDEIQTGVGRAGAWFSCEDEGVTPHILLAGKGLSGGVVPVAATLAREEIFRPLGNDPILHSSTFAGGPLACAAVLATIEVIHAGDLITKARSLGESLLADVEAVVAESFGELVREVRGRGLLLAIDMARDDLAGELVLGLLERGVIVSSSANAFGTVRLTPSVNLADDDRAVLLAALADAGRELRAAHGTPRPTEEACRPSK